MWLIRASSYRPFHDTERTHHRVVFSFVNEEHFQRSAIPMCGVKVKVWKKWKFFTFPTWTPTHCGIGRHWTMQDASPQNSLSGVFQEKGLLIPRAWWWSWWMPINIPLLIIGMLLGKKKALRDRILTNLFWLKLG